MSHRLVLKNEPPTKLSRSNWYTELGSLGMALTICFKNISVNRNQNIYNCSIFITFLKHFLFYSVSETFMLCKKNPACFGVNLNAFKQV